MDAVARRLLQTGTVAIALAGRAASADVTDPSAAERLFRQGRASAEAGDYAHACVAFAESLRQESAPGTLLNLADCEERTGRLASAWSHFVRLENSVPDRDERKAIARERAAALAARVPWMTITLGAGTPADARVFRDDVELDAAHRTQPSPVDPGPHRVLVVAPGREARLVTVTIAEREAARVVASAGPVMAARAGAQAGAAPSHAAAWFVGALGVASLGVGAAFGARALTERSTSDAACTGGTCNGAAGLAAYDSARSDARVADVALGVGLVGVAVSVTLFLTSRSVAPRVGGLQLTTSGVGGTW